MISVEEEIKAFEEKAGNARRTGYPELYEWYMKIAGWLKELLDLRERLNYECIEDSDTGSD